MLVSFHPLDRLECLCLLRELEALDSVGTVSVRSFQITDENRDDLCPYTIDPVTGEKLYGAAPCTGCLGNTGPPTPRDPETNLKYQPTEYDLRYTYRDPYCSEIAIKTEAECVGIEEHSVPINKPRLWYKYGTTFACDQTSEPGFPDFCDPAMSGPDNTPDGTWPDGGLDGPRYRESDCNPCSTCSENKCVLTQTALGGFRPDFELSPENCYDPVTNQGFNQDCPGHPNYNLSPYPGCKDDPDNNGGECLRGSTCGWNDQCTDHPEYKMSAAACPGTWYGEGYTSIKRSSIVGVKNKCMPLNPGSQPKLVEFIAWYEGTRWTNEPYDAFQNLDAYKDCYYTRGVGNIDKCLKDAVEQVDEPLNLFKGCSDPSITTKAECVGMWERKLPLITTTERLPRIWYDPEPRTTAETGKVYK